MSPAVSVKVVVASVTCSSLMRCTLRVEYDELHGRPVARRAAPALRVCTAHAFVQRVASRQYGAFAPMMTLIGRHVSDRAMTVPAVVPVDEASNPAVRRREVGEGQPRVRWRVLQCSKQCL